jgi:outer membrane receptor for ferrienterochelin and colicins
VNANYTAWWRLKKTTLSIDASLFYTYFTNQIIGDFFSDPQKIIYDNLDGHAISQGATLNGELSFPTGLKINTGVTVMDVFRKEKNSLGLYPKTPQLFAPHFSGNYTVSYNFRKAGVLVDWTGKINSPMYLPVVPNDFRPGKSPWFCIMNLQLTKRFPHNFEVYAGAKNLLDFVPKYAMMRPFDPFNKHVDVDNPNNYTFDPSYNFAPIQGLKGFLGVRWTMN